MNIRSARPADAAQLAVLFGQLGHAQTEGELRNRLEELRADPRAGVVVADNGGSLLGAATYFFVPVAHDSRPWCRITTLVVDEAHRGHGVGRMLVGAAEAAARDHSCSRIEATSALHRAAAHRFYEALGYGRTSAHFLKRL
jgi:GNAT superfamily N-acetyltransferase